jgi:hypothetical protein
MKQLSVLWLGLTLTLPVAAADVAPLAPMDLTYSVDWSGLALGEARVTLNPDPNKPGCYDYRSATHPIALVKALVGEPYQESLFCLRDGKVVSLLMKNVSPGRQQDEYQLTFDWDKHVVTNQAGEVRPLPDGGTDVFSLEQAVRLWVRAHAADSSPPEADIIMVDNKHIQTYKFHFVGHEAVDVPAGHFDALVVERFDNPGKIAKFWISPDRGYIVLRGEQRNGNGPLITMQLEH